MVEVFTTNVSAKKDAEGLLIRFRSNYPDYNVNFDLEDCDHVLRVESHFSQIDVDGVCGIVTASGFCVEVMPDISVSPSKIEFLVE